MVSKQTTNEENWNILQVADIKKYVNLYSGDFTKIANKMGRSESSVRDRLCIMYGECKNKGDTELICQKKTGITPEIYELFLKGNSKQYKNTNKQCDNTSIPTVNNRDIFNYLHTVNNKLDIIINHFNIEAPKSIFSLKPPKISNT